VIPLDPTIYHLLILATLLPIIAWIYSWWIDDDD
jgi:hypothetical protein